jgi:Lrp/AsnC family transcriptional regulator for asnA, asnC and gidA
LLKLLANDGRKSYKELAQELGVSNVTIRNRLNRLIENRSLLIIAWLDPREIGITCGAHVSISVDSPRVDEVAQRIAEFPEVVWIGTSIGEFNIMADIWCIDMDQMNKFVGQKLNRIDGVRHLVVSPYIDIYKITTLPNLELLNNAR